MENTPLTASTGAMRIRATLLVGCLLATGLSACSSLSSIGRVDRHGQILTSEDLESVKTGMSKNQVLVALGTPSTTSSMQGSVFYYMSHKTKTVSMLMPKTIDRKIIAVYFNRADTVVKLANYGMKDGRIFDYISRKTPSHGGDYSFLQQMFGNLGKKVSPF